MPACEKLEKCPFFNDKMDNAPATCNILKQTFCLSNKQSCARYQVASAGLPVPSDLFPHNSGKAQALLAKR